MKKDFREYYRTLFILKFKLRVEKINKIANSKIINRGVKKMLIKLVK